MPPRGSRKAKPTAAAGRPRRVRKLRSQTSSDAQEESGRDGDNEASKEPRQRPGVPEIEDSADEEEGGDNSPDDAFLEAASSSPSNSQTTDDLAQLVQKMVDDQRKRRAARRSAITKSYANYLNETRSSIETMLREHEELCETSHAGTIKRLRWLLDEKRRIEERMVERRTALRNAYLAYSRDFQKVVEARIAWLDDADDE